MEEAEATELVIIMLSVILIRHLISKDDISITLQTQTIIATEYMRIPRQKKERKKKETLLNARGRVRNKKVQHIWLSILQRASKMSNAKLRNDKVKLRREAVAPK